MSVSRYEPFRNLLESGVAKPVADYSGPFAAFYDEIGGKQEGDVDFYLNETKPGDRVVELGAGTGRIAIPLAKEGREVMAVDIAPAMLNELQRKVAELNDEDLQGRLRVVEASLTEFRSPEVVDVVLLPFNTIYHLLQREERLAAFKSAFANLRPGGRFIVHYGLVDRDVPSQHYWVGSPRGSNGLQHMVVNHTDFDPKTRINDFRALHFTFLADGRYECHYMRTEEFHPTIPEIKELLGESGFEVDGLFGDFAKTPLRDCSRREFLLAVATKPIS